MRLPSVFYSQTVTYGFAVLGVALVVLPALVPLQPVLVHDASPGTTANASQLEEQGIEVINYENLSARGQELYVETLRARGQYAVPQGQGAPEFEYPTPSYDEDDRQRFPPGVVAIERPADAALPRPLEPVYRAGQVRARERPSEGAASDGSGRETASADDSANASDRADGPTREEARRQIERYDLLATRTGQPSPANSGAILRLFSVVVGVTAISISGYRSSLP